MPQVSATKWNHFWKASWCLGQFKTLLSQLLYFEVTNATKCWWISFSLFLKASLGAHPFIWKWDFIHMQIKLIFIWLCTKSHFGEEAKGNSEITYFSKHITLPWMEINNTTTLCHCYKITQASVTFFEDDNRMLLSL